MLEGRSPTAQSAQSGICFILCLKLVVATELYEWRQGVWSSALLAMFVGTDV